VRKTSPRSVASLAGSTALAIYGGLAWIGCLSGGVLIGAAIHEWPDDGTTMGGSHSLAAAFPEIAVSTLVLLVLAYGLFAWLLSRQDDSAAA
jgi:hypothetical protein